MSLASYTPETREVPLGRGQTFSVSGLSLQDVEILIRTHLEDIEALFDLFTDGTGNFEADDLKKLAISLATRAPGFVANVIALAAGERDATANAARLPMPVQIQALHDIGELTFTEVGGIKKFMETVAALLSTVSATMPQKLSKATTRMTNLG